MIGDLLTYSNLHQQSDHIIIDLHDTGAVTATDTVILSARTHRLP